MGRGREVTDMVEPNPIHGRLLVLVWRGQKLWWGECRSWSKNQTPEHVPQGSCQARIRHVPLNTRPTYRPADVTPNFLLMFRHFWHSILSDQKTSIPADTPSIWSYSLSPLKTSQATEVSWLVLPDQVLLLWEVVINYVDNPTNKLAAFCPLPHWSS
jgi:hypothetical protein